MAALSRLSRDLPGGGLASTFLCRRNGPILFIWARQCLFGCLQYLQSRRGVPEWLCGQRGTEETVWVCMPESDRDRSGPGDHAEQWIDLLAAARATGVTGGLVFDGSVESLGSLQQHVRSVADPYWLLDADHQDDTIALVGYLGQTLLAIVGGQMGLGKQS